MMQAPDVGLAADLHAACFTEEGWNAQTIAELLAMAGGFGFWASAGASHRPLGLILARAIAEECEILSLCVRPANRRWGIGRRLLLTALDMAAARGATRAYLEVAEDNEPARCLYMKHGFAIIGSRPNYYRRQDTYASNALILGRDLI
jgi:ribosomal-protein-alanine N-acetyltransferase